ncbi:GIY-YIG nuclease family protein [Sphingobium sp. EM0848]|uniref:GIY-YIG nuclease family protein n=1 Tax=Sphingobium sp. EM0848 TaxID=2743473 RepID=UPI00159C982A|nr:GIY-YIG nuclease family protein [Sphingobium sp. EM0848]
MKREINSTVYILASRKNGTLYTGVTSDLVKRLYEHRNGLIDGFTSDYGVKRLVWFETHDAMDSAIVREKRIKKWNRQWKIELIEAENPEWDDLALAFGFEPLPALSRERAGDGFPLSRE